MSGDPIDLDAIENAAARARGIPGADTLASIFVPHLVAEVRRLTGLAERERARGDALADCHATAEAEVRRLRAHVDGLSEDKQRLRRECGCLASDALSDCCDVNVSPYWERRFVSPWERVK